MYLAHGLSSSKQLDKMSDPSHKQIADHNYTYFFLLWLNSKRDLGNILQTQQPVSDNMLLLTRLELWNSRWLTGFFPVDVNGLGDFFFLTSEPLRGEGVISTVVSLQCSTAKSKDLCVYEKITPTPPKNCICCLTNPMSCMSNSTCFYFIF